MIPPWPVAERPGIELNGPVGSMFLGQVEVSIRDFLRQQNPSCSMPRVSRELLEPAPDPASGPPRQDLFTVVVNKNMIRDAMSEAVTMSFGPDWVSPPGDTIADLLEERCWTQAEFAIRLGTSRKFVNQLLSGEASINEATALKLERVLGSTIRFWLNREAEYRAALANRREIEMLRNDLYPPERPQS